MQAVLERRPVAGAGEGATCRPGACLRAPRSPAGSQRLNRPARQRTHVAARRDEAEAHAVARLHVRHARSDCLDDARALVPEDHRPAPAAELAVGEVEVGMADAGRCDTDEDLVVSRGVELDVLDRNRCPRLAQDGGPHLLTRVAVLLERVEIGDDAEARACGRRDRPVGCDLERRGQQPVAPRGRPAPAGRAAPRRTGTTRAPSAAWRLTSSP